MRVEGVNFVKGNKVKVRLMRLGSTRWLTISHFIIGLQTHAVVTVMCVAVRLFRAETAILINQSIVWDK